MGTTGILFFALGGAIIIFALPVAFSTGIGPLFGAVLGFVGFLAVGTGLSDLLASAREPSSKERPLNLIQKVGIAVLVIGTAISFMAFVGVAGTSLWFTIASVAIGLVLLALGKRMQGTGAQKQQG